MRRTVVLFLVIAMVGGVQAAFGQAAGAVVRGHIVDDTGGALPGVTVELRSEGGGMEPQVQVSDGGGDYTFDGWGDAPVENGKAVTHACFYVAEFPSIPSSSEYEVTIAGSPSQAFDADTVLQYGGWVPVLL